MGISSPWKYLGIIEYMLQLPPIVFMRQYLSLKNGSFTLDVLGVPWSRLCPVTTDEEESVRKNPARSSYYYVL